MNLYFFSLILITMRMSIFKQLLVLQFLAFYCRSYYVSIFYYKCDGADHEHFEWLSLSLSLSLSLCFANNSMQISSIAFSLQQYFYRLSLLCRTKIPILLRPKHFCRTSLQRYSGIIHRHVFLMYCHHFLRFSSRLST